jgi:hypothetical protein
MNDLFRLSFQLDLRRRPKVDPGRELSIAEFPSLHFLLTVVSGVPAFPKAIAFFIRLY